MLMRAFWRGPEVRRLIYPGPKHLDPAAIYVPNVCTLKHVANYFVFDFLAASQLEEKAESLKQQMINKRHVFFD